MTIEFPCPACAQLVRTPDAAAGKRGKCPSCAAVVQIPTAIPAVKPAVKEPPTQPVAPKPAAEDTGPIEFLCSSCGQLVRTPRAAAGKKGKCPHCAEIVLIPLTNKPPVAAKPAPAGPTPQVAKSAQPQPPRKPAPAPKPKVEDDIVEAELDESPLPSARAPAFPKSTPRPASAPKPRAPRAAPQASLTSGPPLTPLGSVAVDPFATFGGASYPGSGASTAPVTGLDPLPALIPLDASLDLNSAPILAEAIIAPSPALNDPFASLPAASALQSLPPATAFAPAFPAAQGPVGSHDTAVNIPAILQLIVTVPMLLLFAFSLLRQIWGLLNLAMFLSRTQSSGSNLGSRLMINLLISLVVYGACIAMQSWIIFGSSKQLQRQSYNQALIAAWLSLIPCVSPMGMPFGIWSLLMLYKDQVKRSFRG